MTVPGAPGSGTVTAQVLQRARVDDGPAGSAFFWASPDLLLGHEATVALLVDRFRRGGLRVKHPERCLFAADHFTPPSTAERASILRLYLDFLEEQGLDRRHVFTGISHQLMLEDHRLRPGLFVAGADSHTTMAGALGAVAAGFGSTDMLVAFARGRVAVRVPRMVRLDLRGRPSPALGTRDLALALMAHFGEAGLGWAGVEVFDQTPDGVGPATRASLCNQAVDAGAKSCLFVPDAITAGWLEARDGAPPDVSTWVLPTPAAAYDDTVGLDLAVLEPLVASPPRPSNVAAARTVRGEVIHQAFVGSCAGGRLEDLREAAEILRGRRVAVGVRMVITPASRAVWLAASREGLLEILVEAGAQVTDSSCGACGGIDKGLLGRGEVAISTSNRNFRGRMGDPEARIFLASARTVAASAVLGRVADPREVTG